MIESYKDIEQSIYFWKERVRMLEKEHFALMQIVEPPGYCTARDLSKERVSGGRVKLDMEELINQGEISRYIKVKKELKNSKDILNELIKSKNELKEKLKNLSGLKYKVEYMRVIEGKSLKEIASELGYSYSYIRNIKMNSKKY